MGIAGSKAARRSKRSKTSIADALFSRTKQRVLGLVFGQPDRTFGIIELIELAESGSGAVQRELERLVGGGLVTVTAGPQKRYQANRSAPIFEELHGIVDKTSGIPQMLRSALAGVAPRICFAALYGSVAKQSDTASSDIDVLVVSDELRLEDLFRALERAEKQLGRRVSPTLYTTEEFRERRRANHPFVAKVMGGKHVVLLGSEDVLTTTR